MKIVYTVKLLSNCYRRYFPNVMGIAIDRINTLLAQQMNGNISGLFPHHRRLQHLNLIDYKARSDLNTGSVSHIKRDKKSRLYRAAGTCNFLYF